MLLVWTTSASSLNFNASSSAAFWDGYENIHCVKGYETGSCICVHAQMLTLSHLKVVLPGGL